MHIDVGINAAGRIGDNARARECLGDQRRNMRVHRPGQRLVAGGAELAPGHEHHIGKLRQRIDLIAIEQVRCDALYAGGAELLAQALLAEASHSHHPLPGSGAPGEPRQRRPDLAADAEDDEIAGNRAELRRQRRRRRGHHLLEMRDVAQALRQSGNGGSHQARLLASRQRPAILPGLDQLYTILAREK